MGWAVRLQYEPDLPRPILATLVEELELGDDDLYAGEGFTAFSDLFQLYAAVNVRVEVAFSVLDPDLPRQVAEILEIQLADTVKARIITATGDSERRQRDGAPAVRSQDRLYKLAGAVRALD
jgi:polyphosphate kinase